MDLRLVAVVLLVALAAAALAYGLLYGRLQTERRTGQRLKKFAAPRSEQVAVRANRDRFQEATKRRKTIESSIKELEEKQKQGRQKAADIKATLLQAGLSATPRQFYVISLIFGLAVTLLAAIGGAAPLMLLGVFAAATLGIPRWILAFIRARRMKAFLIEFPNALDVIVRSLRSGLPLNDALRLIAAEGQEPVKSEFRRIVESQQMGLSVPEACARLQTAVPLSETKFFAIVINIQAQAGGNLSEALGNLSRVLRDRRKMKAKVQALSMEAKASAVIIGALPFIVGFLVYVTSPDYMMQLFTDPRGHLILGASAVWMSIGIFVMRNMINFEV